MRSASRSARRWLVSLFAVALVLPMPWAPAWADEKVAEKAAPAEAAANAVPAVKRVPLLWEVDTSPKIYLFGTIHIADERVLKHPPVVQKALDESGALYTELVMEQQNMAGMMKRVMLPADQSLTKLLPEDVYARTEKFLATKGMPLKALDRLKIWAVWMQLQMLDAPKPKEGQTALDVMLYQTAKGKEKTVGGLETTDEQIDIFDNLSTEEQVKLLDQTVTGLAKAEEEGVKPLELITQAYLAGDADALFKDMFDQTDMSDPLSRKLLTKMLDDRNIRMVNRMLKKAQEHPDKALFVAVGAGHYPGKMGILQLLRNTGYRVRQLETLEDMGKPWPLVTPKTNSEPVRMRRRYRRVGPFCIPGPCCPVPAR